MYTQISKKKFKTLEKDTKKVIMSKVLMGGMKFKVIFSHFLRE